MGLALGLAMIVGATAPGAPARGQDQPIEDIEAGLREFEASKRKEVDDAIDEVKTALASQEEQLAVLREQVEKSRAGLQRLQAIQTALASIPATPAAPAAAAQPVAISSATVAALPMPPVPSRVLPGGGPAFAPPTVSLTAVTTEAPAATPQSFVETAPMPTAVITQANPGAPTDGRFRVTFYMTDDNQTRPVCLEGSLVGVSSPETGAEEPAGCCQPPAAKDLPTRVKELEQELAQLKAQLQAQAEATKDRVVR
jgi:hypothetical protein